jgi:hypothetical protein
MQPQDGAHYELVGKSEDLKRWLLDNMGLHGVGEAQGDFDCWKLRADGANHVAAILTEW